MGYDEHPFFLFAGSSHPALAKEVASSLKIELGHLSLDRFPDGEISVQIQENVRGRDTFVLQSVALDPDRYLMELLVIIDALKRASARTIIPVIAYYGYARQDRKDHPRVPITARLVADMLTTAGATSILAMDLHAGQVEGFFDIPVDNLHATPILARAFAEQVKSNVVVVAPDIGSVKLARNYATQLNAGFVIVDKVRVNPRVIGEVTVIGDVKGKDILLADDMCSTGNTLVSAAKACREKGAQRIFACVTHGLFVGDAVQLIEKSPLEAVLTSNTIPYTDRLAGFSKLRTVSVAPLFAQAIHCVLSRESISSL